jgi:transcription elongation factor GreA
MIDNKNKVYVTKEGHIELQNEINNLINVVRLEVIEDLQAARAMGDLSENADYDAARDRQAKVEARIRELEIMLQNIEIITETKGRTIKLGSTFTIMDMESDEEETYTIVGSVESDPLNGKLSNVTVVATALMEHKVGDVVTIPVDKPYQVKILNIK